MITRCVCLISSCAWTHDFPDVPAGPWPWKGSIHDTVAAVSLTNAAVREQVVREHFESHPLLEWLTEVQRQTRRADRAEEALAACVAAKRVEDGAP